MSDEKGSIKFIKDGEVIHEISDDGLLWPISTQAPTAKLKVEIIEVPKEEEP